MEVAKIAGCEVSMENWKRRGLPIKMGRRGLRYVIFEIWKKGWTSGRDEEDAR